MSSDNSNEVEQGKVVDAVNRFQKRGKEVKIHKTEEERIPARFLNVFQLPEIVAESKVMLCIPMEDGIALSNSMYRVKVVRPNGTIVLKLYKKFVEE